MRRLLFSFVVIGCCLAADPVPDDMRDITGIEKVPPAPARPTWPTWLGLSAAGALVLVVIGRRLARRCRIQQSPPPPDRWALDALAGITVEPDGPAEVERIHTLVSNVLRHYLERRFHLKALSQTTPEFLRDLEGSAQLTAAQKEMLARFLERCDRAKFAPVAMASANCGEALRLARDFVEQTRP